MLPFFFTIAKRPHSWMVDRPNLSILRRDCRALNLSRSESILFKDSTIDK